MVLTREYETTVVARIQRDRKFARALCAEALNALLEGETQEGLSMLRDLVHAGISFKELAEQTGLGEKALHRMLSPRGNPRAAAGASAFAAPRRDTTHTVAVRDWICPALASLLLCRESFRG